MMSQGSTRRKPRASRLAAGGGLLLLLGTGFAWWGLTRGGFAWRGPTPSGDFSAARRDLNVLLAALEERGLTADAAA